MAPKSEKRRQENQQVAQFVEQLYELGGFPSWGEFGRQAGMNLASTVSDWKRGENAPSGYNLLRLIWAAQRQNEAALALASQATDPVVALALQMARDMSKPLPEPMDEILERLEAVERIEKMLTDLTAGSVTFVTPDREVVMTREDALEALRAALADAVAEHREREQPAAEEHRRAS